MACCHGMSCLMLRGGRGHASDSSIITYWLAPSLQGPGDGMPCLARRALTRGHVVLVIVMLWAAEACHVNERGRERRTTGMMDFERHKLFEFLWFGALPLYEPAYKIFENGSDFEATRTMMFIWSRLNCLNFYGLGPPRYMSRLVKSSRTGTILKQPGQ